MWDLRTHMPDGHELKKKKKREIRDFPGGPANGVQTKVRELRSHIPCGKKKNEKTEALLFTN